MPSSSINSVPRDEESYSGREVKMRVPMIAGNWKMNTTLNEATALVSEMLPLLEQIDNVEKVVCPPFISLAGVAEVLRGSSVKLGAQNVYFEEKGAYTGEISPAMLADICEFVIIGHSERRQYFGETSEVVNRKVQSALRFNLKPREPRVPLVAADDMIT